MITLDGSYGEGGGALVRTALALSTMTGKECLIKNIRAGRPNPGLKAQHLQAIQALQQICKAETNPIELGSMELHYRPGKVKAGIYHIDIGTAGSISLLLQALVLPCMFAPNKVTLIVKGGTCGKWQAPVEYLQNILLPFLQRFVEKIDVKIIKRGYFPVGGGEVKIEIKPQVSSDDPAVISLFCNSLPKYHFEKQGKLEQIRGIVNVSSDLQEKEVAERIKHAAEVGLREFEVPKTIRVEYSNTFSTGGEIVLWGVFSGGAFSENSDATLFMGSSALVEKAKKSEEIGKDAAKQLAEEINSGYPIDPYLADQLIPFMALLPGSVINTRKITDHTLTNIYVTEQFLPVGFKIGKNMIMVVGK
ncbi:MAG TPA: RNA 3'-terminal phosphate cyclase [Candidatus Nanoarchaeia archaeon]|nr:RNA 3'-terminal phosphate cyclase [Candidatus Nanoarchaeia archaeon]